MRGRSVILIFILILSSFPAFSKMSELQGNVQMPVEWQVIKLQENIEEKITRSLMPLIRPEEYVIEVKIGIDTEKVEDPSSKKVMKNIQKKKVRFSNSEIPKEGDDYVLFEKLGLEAPIFGEEPVEMQTSEVELAQKALIELNDRYNLFNFLGTIDINLTFDKGLNAKTKESIQKVVHGLSFNTKDVLPQINIQYLDLKSAKTPSELLKGDSGSKDKNGELSDNKNGFFDRFKNLDVMIGLILSALLLALAAIYVARKGSKVEEEVKAKNDNEEKVESEAIEETQSGEEQPIDEGLILEGDDMSIDLTKTDPQTTRINEGLERFRKIYQHHYNDMALMIKAWIKIAKNEEATALKSLVQMLTDVELTEIFKCLTIDERSTWKMCLDGELNKEELAKSFAFISNQIMQTMMVPSLIDDYEICDLLLALRAEDAAQYSEEVPELGMIFANVLSSKTIGEMLKMIPVDLASEIIVMSSSFKKEDIINKMPVLKEKLLEFKAKRERPPFIKRIFDILPSSRPELEKKLYATLLNHLSMDEVVNVAMKAFPSDLLVYLPDTLYKDAVGKMPSDVQVQYFICLNEEDREAAMNRFAAKGSKQRDMVDLEINSLLKNEMLTSRIRNEKKEALELEFLGFVRNYINETEEAKKEIYTMVEGWLKEIKSDDSHLKVKLVA
jgi:hypothetical protein